MRFRISRRFPFISGDPSGTVLVDFVCHIFLLDFKKTFQSRLTVKKMKNGVELTHLSDGYRMTRFQFGQMLADKLGKPLSLITPKSAESWGYGAGNA